MFLRKTMFKGNRDLNQEVLIKGSRELRKV